jgi:hypothetical protein
MSDSWTIKAYQHKNGKRTLIEWATGFGTRQAREYFQMMYDTNEYSEIRMSKAKPDIVLFKDSC